MLNLCTVNTILFKVSFKLLIEAYKLGQKHICKIESIVVFQSNWLNSEQYILQTGT